MQNEKELVFPQGFYWGSATSAHQVEGMNANSDWWAWEQEEIKKTLPKIKDLSAKACDHYDLFAEDFDWVKNLGQNAHRLSIEWARLEPEPGKWSQEVVGHYRDVFAALRERKIEPFVAAMHFTLPRWLADKGGWLNPDAPLYFKNYVNFLIENFGDQIKYWVTMNEPLILAEMSYRRGVWAPGKVRSWVDAFFALRNMARAHKLAYRAMKDRSAQMAKEVEVGIVHNLIAILPADKNSIFDVLLAKIMSFFVVDLYLKFFNGHEDFYGVNYYFEQRVHFDIHKPQNMFKGVDSKDEKRSDMGWTIRPEGLYQVLVKMKKFSKPIYITENGIADSQDKFRAQFIIEHLKEVHRAITQGVNVRGYFYWSLMDNFEWADGFAPRFGLLAIDYSDLSRTARKSAMIYQQICSSNRIPNSMNVL